MTLTSLVADCLNKDPKEYLPTLNEYQKLPKTKLKYTIDHKLRRYSRAAISLIELEETGAEEIVSYTERYKIHEVVIKYLEDQLHGDVCGDKKVKLEKILEQEYQSFARVFAEQQNHLEAAICYYRGKDFGNSCDSYGKGGQWASAISLAQSVGLENYDDLLRKLVKYSEERKVSLPLLQSKDIIRKTGVNIILVFLFKDYDSAGQILEYHLKDNVEAFRSYTKGRNWDHASRLASTTTVQAEFKRELESAASSLQDSCISLREEISKYRSRLRIVKELKEKAALAAEGNFGEGDNFSDTESVSTTASVRSSGASSAYTG